MLIKLCKKEGIKTIGTVRRAEQVKTVMSDHVINTADSTWKAKMGEVCNKLKPTGFLDAVSGDMLGEIMNFLSYGGTCIVYGLLSEKPGGNINNFAFIGNNLKIESFILGITTNSMS